MDTTEIEKKSLEAHVELCAERYRQLDHRLETLTEKITALHANVDRLAGTMHKANAKVNDQLLAWGGSLVVVLLGTISWLASKYFV